MAAHLGQIGFALWNFGQTGATRAVRRLRMLQALLQII